MVVELRSGADGVDEYLVDLDDVDAELEHIGQPAVAGPDVIDGDAHAKPLESRDGLPCRGEIFDRVALGHFQHHLRDRRAGKNFPHVLDDSLVAKQLTGEIERDLECRPAADRATCFGANPPHHIAGYFADQSTRPASGINAPGSTSVPSVFRQRTRTSAPRNCPERISTIGW